MFKRQKGAMWHTMGTHTTSSRSAHSPLTVRSRSAHGQLTVNSRSAHGPLMVKEIFLRLCLNISVHTNAYGPLTSRGAQVSVGIPRKITWLPPYSYCLSIWLCLKRNELGSSDASGCSVRTAHKSLTVSWPRVYRELTVCWPWADREFTVRWP
jgi:hypothetical protein